MKCSKMISAVCLASAIFVSGCSDSRFSSSEDIMEELLQQSEKAQVPNSIYQETVTTNYENDQMVNKETLKYWQDFETGKDRFEFRSDGNPTRYSVFNGQERIVYTEGEEQALIMGPPKNPPTKGVSTIDNLIQMIQSLSSTHEITFAGEEKIEGVDTYHLKLKAKDQNAIVGNQEFWINQETWMLKKAISEIGNKRQETLYTASEANPTVADNFYNFKLPEGVKRIEDQSGLKIVSLDDIKSFFNQQIFYYPGTKEIQMLPGEQNDNFISINYTKEGLTYLTIFMEKAEENEEKIQGDYKIRGNAAQLTKQNGVGYSLTWIEDGIKYTIFDAPNVLKKEDILKIAENMEKY